MGATAGIMSALAGPILAFKVMGAMDAKKQADYQAQIEAQQADLEHAKSQREALNIKEQTKRRVGEQVAVGAGGGVSQSDIGDIVSDTEFRGNVNALTAFYEGEQKASDLNYQSKLTKHRGKQQFMADMVGIATDVATTAGGFGMAGKFGGAKPAAVSAGAGKAIGGGARYAASLR